MIPCPRCKERLEAPYFAAHLKHCHARGAVIETDEERDARMAEDASEKPAFTAYQKRIARENMRRFGHPMGMRAVERERAISVWETEGGR